MSLSFFCFLGWSLWQCCSNYWCCAAVVPGHSALGSTSLCCQQAWAHCYHVLHTACSSYGPNVHVRSLPLSLGMCTSSSPVTKIRYEYLPFLVFQHFLGFWSQTDSWQSSVSITVGCTFWSLPQGNFLEPFGRWTGSLLSSRLGSTSLLFAAAPCIFLLADSTGWMMFVWVCRLSQISTCSTWMM